MTTKTKDNYSISGMDIEVETVQENFEARVVTPDTTYRIKLAPGSQIPLAGRYHYSMALAEPIIPEPIYSAMLDAVSQHAKG
jgi:hypothetical protein